MSTQFCNIPHDSKEDMPMIMARKRYEQLNEVKGDKPGADLISWEVAAGVLLTTLLIAILLKIAHLV